MTEAIQWKLDHSGHMNKPPVDMQMMAHQWAVHWTRFISFQVIDILNPEIEAVLTSKNRQTYSVLLHRNLSAGFVNWILDSSNQLKVLHVM